jgi:integrase
MKLSPHAVRTAQVPAGKSETIFFDDHVPGFGLRLRAQGSRTFVFQYKLGTKQRRMALGAATALGVAKVRQIAERLHARVKLGEDPASDKADAKVNAARTFKTIAEEYLEQRRDDLSKGRLRERTYPDLERHLLKHAKSLHELQLAKISRADIASVLLSVTKNSGAVTANRVRTSLSGFYTWAMEQGIADTNTVIGTARHKEQSRDRVLAPAELRLIWNALSDDDFGSIIKLLALTGQRAAEIAGLCRSEIADGTIVLPAERTKNHRPHIVPLSPAAAAIIEAQPKREKRDLIFGRGEKPFSGWSNCKERLDARIKKANSGKAIPHWTPHDLRRTFATYAGGGLPEHQIKKLPPQDTEAASGLGIQPHVVEAALNHISGHKAGVAGTYNRSTYAREKKAALDLWADRLMVIVENRASNVTPLRRGA